MLRDLSSFKLLEKDAEGPFDSKIISLRSDVGTSPTEFYFENFKDISNSSIVFPIHIFWGSIVYSRSI
jgi:hypothetical protein